MNGFYAGSFDPITNGHVYVIKLAAELFDEVVVGIGHNPDKKRNFEPDAIKVVLEQILTNAKLSNVRVITYDDLTVNQAKEENCQFLIRGLRDGVDYGAEEVLARTNFTVGGLETIYFRAGDTAHVSSSVVMQLAKYDTNISGLVPPEMLLLINAR
ncbi:MAG: pantetheine-phosphate adenylyltransferase [Pseudomonadales bacterium]|nr:pantetheine-phosphate adenylyltransferase [Pseudomonadales bacterium]